MMLSLRNKARELRRKDNLMDCKKEESVNLHFPFFVSVIIERGGEIVGFY